MGDDRLKLEGMCRVQVSSCVVAKENHCSFNQLSPKGFHRGSLSVLALGKARGCRPAPHAAYVAV